MAIFRPVAALLLIGLVIAAYATEESVEEQAAKYRLLGDEAFKAKKYDTSLEHYSKAVELQPDNYMNVYKRSGVYLMRGRNKKALRDLDRVLELNPEHAQESITIVTRLQTLVRRGKLLLQMGEFDAAEESLREALRLKPSNTIAQTQLHKIAPAKKLREQAEKFTADNKYKEARSSWKKLVDVADACESCLLGLAQASYDLGDMEAVIEETIKLLKVNARNLQGLLLRGLALSASGDVDTAMKFYRQGLKSDPDNRKLKEQFLMLKKFSKTMDRARDAYTNQQWQVAFEEYGEASEILPTWHEVHVFFERRCRAMVELKKPKEAIVECNRAIGISDDLYEAHLFKGEALLLDDDPDAAYREFSRARTINQHDRRAMEALKRTERLQKMKSRKDYYKILEVSKTATPSQIRKAYRKKALEWHPDKHKGETKEESERMIFEINEAYEVLNDAEKRGKYDRGEDLEEHQHQGHPFQHGSPFHFTWNFG